MIFQNQVTRIAQKLFQEVFTDTSKLEKNDKEKILISDSCADRLCRLWQKEVSELSPDQYLPEAQVAGSSPIDLVDLKEGIAYELKYSQKNVKHEFYKDLFKVLVYNEEAESRINRFVFLCHHEGISSLTRSSLSQAAVKYMQNHGIEVSFIELYPILTDYDQTA